jgi:PAS domain S-box-containing protein
VADAGGPAGATMFTDLESAIDRVSDGVLVLDTDWVCRFVNRACGLLLDRDPQQLIGRNFWEEFPEAVGSAFDVNYRLAMKTQQMVQFEEYVEPARGLFAIRAFPSPDGITIYFQDINEVRRLELERARALAELREAHARRRQFEALVEGSSDFIAMGSLDGRMRYVSPGGRALIGLDPDADVTTMTFEDFCTPEGYVHTSGVQIPATLRDGQWAGEKTLRNFRGGPPIPVIALHFVIRDPDTLEPFAIASVQRDITARLEAEQKLRELARHRRQLMDRLVVAQEAERATIAADVHDDSVQALAAVDIRLGMLQRKIADVAPELTEQVRQLQDSVSHATDRLRQLLFDLEPPRPGEKLADTLREVAAHIFEDCPVSWSVDGDIAGWLGDAERNQAVRIAKEALTNARDHAQAATVRVELVEHDDGVEITVCDDGIGLDPESATSPAGHRGLTTMRDRAEISGGWWRLERGAQGGTTVRFFLPCDGTDQL